MNFFNTGNLGSIVNFAERSRAGLLIHGHHRATEDSIDKGRFAGIEISGEKDSGRGTLYAGAELVGVVRRR